MTSRATELPSRGRSPTRNKRRVTSPGRAKRRVCPSLPRSIALGRECGFDRRPRAITGSRSASRSPAPVAPTAAAELPCSMAATAPMIARATAANGTSPPRRRPDTLGDRRINRTSAPDPRAPASPTSSVPPLRPTCPQLPIVRKRSHGSRPTHPASARERAQAPGQSAVATPKAQERLTGSSAREQPATTVDSRATATTATPNVAVPRVTWPRRRRARAAPAPRRARPQAPAHGRGLPAEDAAALFDLDAAVTQNLRRRSGQVRVAEHEH